MVQDKDVGKKGDGLTPLSLMEIAREVRLRVPEGATAELTIHGIGADALHSVDLELYKMANGGSGEGFFGDAGRVTATVGGVRFDIRS